MEGEIKNIWIKYTLFVIDQINYGEKYKNILIGNLSYENYGFL